MYFSKKEIKDKYNDYQIEMRRYFHQFPEVSEAEFFTSKNIKEQLSRYNIPYVACGLQTGILATIKGEKEGKTVLLRADIDGLSVPEENDLPYKSKNEGVMHACGHDCHISMLLTAARILNDNRDKIKGTVKLAFQPAEEVGKGAASMIENGVLENVDGAFAIHVWSTIDSGKISCEPGPRMASNDIMKIKIQGKGGHGAAPHECIDAAVVASAIVNNLQHIASREVSPLEPVVVTIGVINVGTRWNVIADKGYLEGTVRCYNKKLWEEIPSIIRRVVEHTAKAYNAIAEVEFERICPPTINSIDVSDLVKEAAIEILGKYAIDNCPPTMASEDFSLFTERTKGAIALLGVGNEGCNAVYPQHSRKYQVDESILIDGALLYSEMACRLLNS